MKTPIISSALLFSLMVLLLGSCNKDDRPAELHTDSQEIVFNKYENVRYFGITNTGNSSMNYQVSSNDAFLTISPSSGILGFNEVAKIEVVANTDILDYGLHTGSILVNSNGGTRYIDVQVVKPLPDPAYLWWDIDYIKIPTGDDRDYITLRNDGESALNYQVASSSSWMEFSKTSGSLEPGKEDVIWVIANRNGLGNNLYSGIVNITSNGGNASVVVDVEVNVYSVSFFNPTYTPIDINVPGMGALQIPVLDRVNYIYPSNPGNIYYNATTMGETVNFQTLGLTLTWNETIDLSNESSPIFDLNIGADYFFLSAVNYGVHDLDMWSINYDTDYQFDEDVNVPNDNYEYYFGYYDALDNTIIYARVVGENYDAVWENGVEFDFPWIMNQGILVESDLKSISTKTNRIFKSTSDEPMTLKMKPQIAQKLRYRNAKALVNQKANR